jgi:hypothetical protein
MSFQVVLTARPTAKMNNFLRMFGKASAASETGRSHFQKQYALCL